MSTPLTCLLTSISCCLGQRVNQTFQRLPNSYQESRALVDENRERRLQQWEPLWTPSVSFWDELNGKGQASVWSHKHLFIPWYQNKLAPQCKVSACCKWTRPTIPSESLNFHSSDMLHDIYVRPNAGTYVDPRPCSNLAAHTTSQSRLAAMRVSCTVSKWKARCCE